jgi:hypothetical protein
MEYEYWDMVVRNIHSASVLPATVGALVCFWSLVMYMVSNIEKRKLMYPFRWILLIPPPQCLSLHPNSVVVKTADFAR